MKINMQIVLSEADIATAVGAYLRSEVPLSESQEINVTFNMIDGEITATAVTDKGEAVASETKTVTRTRRSKAQIQADAEAEQAALEAAGKEPVVEETKAEEPEAEDEPPFEVDPVATKEEAIGIPAKEAVTMIFGSKEAAPVTSPQIFPSVGTSAPVLPVVEPDPAVAAKSLFANLVRPNSQPNH